MPFLVDLNTLMTDDFAVCEALGTDLFNGPRSSPPALASGRPTLVIIETSGSGSERTQNTVIIPGYLHVSAQLTFASDDPDQAEEMANDAWDGLVGIRNSWISNGLASGWYREINCTQRPFPGGLNDRGQDTWQFNITAVKRP